MWRIGILQGASYMVRYLGIDGLTIRYGVRRLEVLGESVTPKP